MILLLVFQYCYFGTLNALVFKLLVKIVLAEICEAVNTSSYFPSYLMDKLVMLGLAERLKNSDFILESKMAELDQNKNSKQPDRPDAVLKTLEINE